MIKKTPNYYIKLNKYEKELKDKNLLGSLSKDEIVDYKSKRQLEDLNQSKSSKSPVFYNHRQDLQRINNTIDKLINF